MANRWHLVFSRIHTAVQYRLRDRFSGRLADYCRPAEIAVLLTDHCTARCVHCDIWKNADRENSLLPGQWTSFLDDLRHWLGPVHLTFTGGEALMKPFAVDVVAHASRIGLLPEVLTHGYWEDQKKIERLALARPWKVTISVDGIGEKHTEIRGRTRFWERTSRSIETLKRVRAEHGLDFTIRLKHVLMAQNAGEAIKVAEYGNQDGMEVCFQPIAQNYNTPEDPEWMLHSANFPADVAPMLAQLRALISRKREGWRITNSVAELEGMIGYFEAPLARRVAAASHTLHEKANPCVALTNLQIQPNGDVLACVKEGPVGNLTRGSIQRIWRDRPRTWRSGCCVTRAENSAIVPLESLSEAASWKP